MHSNRFFNSAWVLAIVAVLQLNCATFVASRMAKKMGDTQLGGQTLNASEIKRIDIGWEVSVDLEDGTSVTGKYAGTVLAQMDQQLDVDVVESGIGNDPLDLPAFGEQISLTDSSGLTIRCSFIGLDPKNLSVVHRGEKWIRTLDINQVVEIEDSEGNIIDRRSLRDLASEGATSSRPVIVLRNGKAFQAISVEDVITITVVEKKLSSRGVMLAGLTVDFFFLALLFEVYAVIGWWYLGG